MFLFSFNIPIFDTLFSLYFGVVWSVSSWCCNEGWSRFFDCGGPVFNNFGWEMRGTYQIFTFGKGFTFVMTAYYRKWTWVKREWLGVKASKFSIAESETNFPNLTYTSHLHSDLLFVTPRKGTCVHLVFTMHYSNDSRGTRAAER